MKTRCSDGTYAHHIVLESPEVDSGGMSAGACLKCSYTVTLPSGWKGWQGTAIVSPATRQREDRRLAEEAMR
jgi:hypothetical protein